ncbi:MAG: hypothetical protein HLX51_01415 [Micrococcaceae bacterium]|nr:hypothetical protein [Micrococcaceae bacterium]
MDWQDDVKSMKLQRIAGHTLSVFGNVAGRFVGPLLAIISFLITGLAIGGMLAVAVMVWLLTEADASGFVLELHEILVTFLPKITQATGPIFVFGIASTILGQLAIVPGDRLLGRGGNLLEAPTRQQRFGAALNNVATLSQWLMKAIGLVAIVLTGLSVVVSTPFVMISNHFGASVGVGDGWGQLLTSPSAEVSGALVDIVSWSLAVVLIYLACNWVIDYGRRLDDRIGLREDGEDEGRTLSDHEEPDELSPDRPAEKPN